MIVSSLPKLFYGLNQIIDVQRDSAIVNVQFCCSATKSRPTLCHPMDCSMPGFPIYNQLPGLLKLMSIESVMPSNHLILCHPLLHLPSIFPSTRGFSNESVLHIRWPEFWSFSFISPSNEYSGLISFRMDWLDLLAVQGTLQHHSSKASFVRHSAFFIVQLSHPYMMTGKTIALTRWTFVGKVMSPLFNMLSRLVITFLPSGSFQWFSNAHHTLCYFSDLISYSSPHSASAPLASLPMKFPGLFPSLNFLHLKWSSPKQLHGLLTHLAQVLTQELS